MATTSNWSSIRSGTTRDHELRLRKIPGLRCNFGVMSLDWGSVIDGISYEKLQGHHKEALITALIKARTVHNCWPLVVSGAKSEELARRQIEAMNENWARTDYCIIARDMKTDEVVGFHMVDDYAFYKSAIPKTGDDVTDAFLHSMYEVYTQLSVVIGKIPPKVIISATIGVGVIPEYNSRGIYSNMLAVLRNVCARDGFQYELGFATHAKTFRAHVPNSVVTHTIVYEEYEYNGKRPLKGVLKGTGSMVLSRVPGVVPTYIFPTEIKKLNNVVESKL